MTALAVEQPRHGPVLGLLYPGSDRQVGEGRGRILPVDPQALLYLMGLGCDLGLVGRCEVLTVAPASLRLRGRGFEFPDEVAAAGEPG